MCAANCNDTANFSVITLLCLVACVASCIISDYPPASFVALCVFFAYTIYLILLRSPFFVKYLYLFFGVVLNVFGCAVCEFTGIDLFELQRNAAFAGSLPLLIFGNLLLIVFVCLFDRMWGIEGISRRAASSINNGLIKIMTICTLLICLALFSKVAGMPSFTLGFDRFEYKEVYLSGIWDHMVTVLQYLIIFPLVSIKKGDRVSGALALGFYFVFLFWAGHKYGAYFHVFVMALLVYYDRILDLPEKTLRSLVAVVLGCMVVLVGFTVFAHGLVSTKSADEYIFQRASQQGQLWWSVYGDYGGGEGCSDFDYEIDAILTGERSPQDSIGSMNGIYGAMYLAAPSDVVDGKLATGAVYTEAGFAMAYYYGSVFGVVLFAAIIAFLLASTTNLLILAIWNEDVIGIVLLVRIYRLVLNAWGAFFFARLLGTTSLASYALILVLLSLYTIKPDRMQFWKADNVAIHRSSRFSVHCDRRLQRFP